ncbi:acetyl esterase/lipase [Pantoea sp. PNA 14-12]|uniref:alpha/beta hydrolase n=1 Tax=Pantoea TaxID=53335 RepID=UPI00050F3786|nr:MULTISPECIES: alpha/beta hydrolase [Pantoea]KGD79997.1 Aes [Pantoea stewartii subsp. indologenes]NRH24616.1 lipase [Pantoea stewartii]QIE99636.1 alpha/beta hydrolase [Pantoea stewartii]TDS67956.1 acetyl esterase/lipase [Pantoea sp. PNA 14-12]
MNVCHTFFIGGLAVIMTMSNAMATKNTELTGYREGAKVIEVQPVRNQIDAITGVVYSQITTLRSVRPLHMSLLVPRTDAVKPAIVYFPGGGFTSADHEKFIQMRMALAEAGFVVAAAEYRVVPDTFPAPVVDGKAAVRYLRQHAETYGIDPHRIGVLGDSAGGWLAQMLGMTNGQTAFDQGDFTETSSDVQAAATIYGISDLRNIGEGFSEENQQVHASPAVTEALLIHGPAFHDFAGASVMDDPDKARQASPMGHLANPKPPFLIMHGDKDSLVSPHQSAQLFDALKKAGDQVEYVVVKGAEHGDEVWYQPDVIRLVVNWFSEVLHPDTRTGSKSTANLNDNL